jgi:hypothetical protein
MVVPIPKAVFLISSECYKQICWHEKIQRYLTHFPSGPRTSDSITMIFTSIKHWTACLLVGSLLGTRVAWAAISEICLNSSLTLSTNAQLVAAAPTGTCEIYVDQAKSCTFDFSTISSNFESVCTNLGGNFYAEDISSACKVSISGTTYSVTYNYLNFPACLGGNCTDTEAMEFYDMSVFPAFEQSLASQGFNCDVSGESASARTALSVVLVIFSAIAAASSFM